MNKNNSNKHCNHNKPKRHSFILELPLIVNSKDERILNVKMESARQLYNAVLGESLKRLSLMKESKQWQYARSLPKNNKEQITERNESFNICVQEFKFTDYDL
jgi:putative transposase